LNSLKVKDCLSVNFLVFNGRDLRNSSERSNKESVGFNLFIFSPKEIKPRFFSNPRQALISSFCRLAEVCRSFSVNGLSKAFKKRLSGRPFSK